MQVNVSKSYVTKSIIIEFYRKQKKKIKTKYLVRKKMDLRYI